MKRTFRRLNVVKETEDERKAKKLLEAGYTEITPKRSQKKKEAPKAEAGEENGTGGEAEAPAEPEGNGA